MIVHVLHLNPTVISVVDAVKVVIGVDDEEKTIRSVFVEWGDPNLDSCTLDKIGESATILSPDEKTLLICTVGESAEEVTSC